MLITGYCVYVVADVYLDSVNLQCNIRTPISPSETDGMVVTDGHSTSWPVDLKCV
jgi:hypothetical protein